MSLVTVKDKFQVTIPARLRARLGLQVGDLLEATVQEGGILLRPKAVVDRDAIASQLATLLERAPLAPEDQGRSEQDILEDAQADLAAARRHRHRG